ncbi:MAG TPA: hypothetical protein VF691_07640 [Cytophagaceae bacterium]
MAVTCYVLPQTSFAQIEENDYTSEYTGGVNLNTNGGLIGGLAFKYSRKISHNQYTYYGLEIINVKHPKETRLTNTSTGNSYIYAKANYLFPIRLQYGREIILFHGAEEEGVQVNFVGALGPTIGLLKPYMIEYDYGAYTQIEPYDPQNPRTPLGSGGLLTGFTKSRVAPGFNLKAALSFQFLQFKGNVTGVEAGGILEGFTQKIPLLVLEGSVQPQNRSFFSSVYVTIFFGFRK